jgi:hypothetical protein
MAAAANGATLLPAQWEREPLNSSKQYAQSPICQFLRTQGHFSPAPDRYVSRSFNRRLKMRDTFTKINPAYHHEPKSCYQIQSFTHKQHPEWRETAEGTPLRAINREYNLKLDPIKVYAESMYRLGAFAPPPRKAAGVAGMGGGRKS